MSSIQIFELVSMIIGLTGTLLVTYKNKTGFIFWIFGNCLWLIYGFITKQYFFAFQYIIFTGLAIFGFLKWTKDDKKLNKSKQNNK